MKELVSHSSLGFQVVTLVRTKTGAMLVVRRYFPHILKCVAEIIKYCDVCQHVSTYKLKMVMRIYPILVPLKVWSQIGNDLIGPTKETDGYGYTVTDVDYKSMFKTGEAFAKFPPKILCWYGSCDIHIMDQGRNLVNSIIEVYHITGTHHHKHLVTIHKQLNLLNTKTEQQKIAFGNMLM